MVSSRGKLTFDFDLIFVIGATSVSIVFQAVDIYIVFMRFLKMKKITLTI